MSSNHIACANSYLATRALFFGLDTFVTLALWLVLLCLAWFYLVACAPCCGLDTFVISVGRGRWKARATFTLFRLSGQGCSQRDTGDVKGCATREMAVCNGIVTYEAECQKITIPISWIECNYKSICLGVSFFVRITPACRRAEDGEPGPSMRWLAPPCRCLSRFHQPHCHLRSAIRFHMFLWESMYVLYRQYIGSIWK